MEFESIDTAWSLVDCNLINEVIWVFKFAPYAGNQLGWQNRADLGHLNEIFLTLLPEEELDGDHAPCRLVNAASDAKKVS